MNVTLYPKEPVERHVHWFRTPPTRPDVGEMSRFGRTADGERGPCVRAERAERAERGAGGRAGRGAARGGRGGRGGVPRGARGGC